VETTILGPDEISRDGITGCPGSFKKLLGAIKMLEKCGVKLSAKTVVMKPNRDKLAAM